jgi:hypothetical protein
LLNSLPLAAGSRDKEVGKKKTKDAGEAVQEKEDTWKGFLSSPHVVV